MERVSVQSLLAADEPELCDEATSIISAQTSTVRVILDFCTDIWPNLYLQRMYLETSEAV